YADGRTHRFVYGARLQTDAETTPGGSAIAYTYGPDAGLTRIAFTPAPGVAPTADVEIARDGLRRAIHLRQGAVDVRRSYDGHERLVSETVDGRTAVIAYDDLAGTATLSYPDGRTDLLSCDSLGR